MTTDSGQRRATSRPSNASLDPYGESIEKMDGLRERELRSGDLTGLHVHVIPAGIAEIRFGKVAERDLRTGEPAFFERTFA